MLVTDQELLSRVAAGETAAFAEFYDRHAGRLLALLRRTVPDGALADDALQETFWQVWTQAGRFDPGRASPVGWLILLARSRAADLMRRHRRRAVVAEPDESIPGPPDMSPEDVEATRLLRGALDSLPDEQRVAIHMAFFGGLTHEQIARKQSLALGTVKTRIRLGIQKLRDSLSAHGRTLA